MAVAREAAAQSANGAARQAWRAAGVAALLLLVFLATRPLLVTLQAADAPLARMGEIDLSGRSPSDRVVPLAGEWRAVWRGGGPSDQPAVGTIRMLRVPGRWSAQAVPGEKAWPEAGVVSYFLRVRNLAPGDYALRLPSLYGASDIRIDGRLRSSSGRVATHPAEAESRRAPQEVAFQHRGGDLRIAIGMAALHHRDNGIESAPMLGGAAAMRAYSDSEWGRDVLYLTTLLLLAVVAAVTYLFRPDDKASLHLALGSLLFLPVSAVFSYDNALLLAAPGLDFRGMLTVQYLCGIGAIAFLLAYTRALFPAEVSSWLFKAFQSIFALLAIAQAMVLLMGDTGSASHISRMSTAAGALALLTMIGIVLLAVRRSRQGALVYLIGLSAFAVMIIIRSAVANSLLRDDVAQPLDFTAVGILLFLISHFILLAERLARAIARAENMNDDLRQMLGLSAAITSEMELERLLARIVEATSKILHADRSTLFLHDSEHNTLWSLFAEGMGDRRIDLAADQGLAGYAFTTGETINVRNAYADARFDHRIDKETGYLSRSILAMPIVTRDGRRLGVLQALNRRGAPAFDEEDERRMHAFAAQAAVALDNARLFTEVVASRNYNESILRSMSSAVITLDLDARVTKLNPAACRILGVDEKVLDGADARSLLTYGNASVMPEVDKVISTGEPKLLFDVDLRNGHGEAVAVNISIVPLLGEAGAAEGALVLIDDISEGKRLQGTMSRFLPQAVVEQVLDHPDELLFGSASTASILFSDIRNFTSIAEELSARETVEMLNEIFSEQFETITAHHGILDKFMGDSVMAVFGAPLQTEQDAENAVRAALRMQSCLDPVNTRRRAAGLGPIRLGTGVATGEVVAGTIGSPKRMDYTVVGDSVNLASRLQNLTKTYGASVLICERTAAAVWGRFALRELDLIRVRGRKAPGRLFEVRGETISIADVPLHDGYEQARKAMTERDWAGALARLEQLVLQFPDDGPTRVMIQRARALLGAPPPLHWDGVWDDRQAA
jgi:adenylate cyclase